MIRCTTLFRLLLCLSCLAAPLRAPAHAGVAAAPALVSLMAAEEKKDDGCRQGERTKAFGWMLVSYGIDTLKYVVGLFLIPIGLLLVCIGAVIALAEAATCG
ncbi:hypothetical protein JOD31_002737 [Methylopila capsulata]|uniref:Uncharacterized protein n=1 Tax=Methylopila capsulata TaxID=61654 RepID=A0A9W6IW66_9HYPH|nr:hypothetical protein [Methylopila capsulata]MBM7852495.1 hypothetical protein [Methylopila capsulata]GLK56704.1 hypothetical protein GCM10008170_27230 [Methylopila capsulata]